MATWGRLRLTNHYAGHNIPYSLGWLGRIPLALFLYLRRVHAPSQIRSGSPVVGAAALGWFLFPVSGKFSSPFPGEGAGLPAGFSSQAPVECAEFSAPSVGTAVRRFCCLHSDGSSSLSLLALCPVKSLGSRTSYVQCLVTILGGQLFFTMRCLPPVWDFCVVRARLSFPGARGRRVSGPLDSIHACCRSLFRGRPFWPLASVYYNYY